jgi:hypothetical protein
VAIVAQIERRPIEWNAEISRIAPEFSYESNPRTECGISGQAK